MEACDRLAVLVGVILEFSDTAQITVIKTFNAEENADAARPLHQIQQFRVFDDIDRDLC